MDIRKIIIFSALLFLTSISINIYGSWQAPLSIPKLILVSALYAILLTIPCSVAYYFGVKKSQSVPNIRRVVLGALFTYFFSYTACAFFGLFQISWFIFPAVSALVAFLFGWRLSANKSLKHGTAQSAAP